MKYIRFARDKQTAWAILEGDMVRPLRHAPWLGVEPQAYVYGLSEVTLFAPVTPSKIVCVGKNYRDHISELDGDVPDCPILFFKPPSALIGPEEPIRIPPKAGRVDYEGELAFVVGKTASNVSVEEALSYIWGYTCLNDVTARDIQKADGQWCRAKGFDSFAPVGPWIETELNPDDLQLETMLSGVVKQSVRTSQFLWNVPELLAFITSCMTLQPGDLVSTGTPAGIGPMRSGDIVSVSIEGIGTLTNPVL